MLVRILIETFQKCGHNIFFFLILFIPSRIWLFSGNFSEVSHEQWLSSVSIKFTKKFENNNYYVYLFIKNPTTIISRPLQIPHSDIPKKIPLKNRENLQTKIYVLILPPITKIAFNKFILIFPRNCRHNFSQHFHFEIFMKSGFCEGKLFHFLAKKIEKLKTCSFWKIKR